MGAGLDGGLREQVQDTIDVHDVAAAQKSLAEAQGRRASESKPSNSRAQLAGRELTASPGSEDRTFSSASSGSRLPASGTVGADILICPSTDYCTSY